MLVSIVFIIIVAAALAFGIAQWRRSKSGQPGIGAPALAAMQQGMLTVTGVSDHREPDKNGQVFCTVSGTITGPQTAPTEVYGDLVLSETDPWPQLGNDLPVLYKVGKVESTWRFGTLPPASPDEGFSPDGGGQQYPGGPTPPAT